MRADGLISSTPAVFIQCVVLMLLAFNQPVAAMDSCHGTYTARLISPVPSPALVDLTTYDDSPRNLRLAEVFMAALREAGAKTGRPAIVQLELSYRVDRGSADAQHSGSGRKNRLRNEFSGLEGGLQQWMPDIAAMNSLRNHGSSSPNRLFLRAQLVKTAPHRVLWVGIVQCAVSSTAAEEQLARDLGELLGGSLGQAVVPRSF